MSDAKPSPQKPRRLRLVLSLRVLMLLIVLVAAALGWKVNRVRIQKRAVARIEAAGGFAIYDYEFSGDYPFKSNTSPAAPVWLRRKLGDEFFQEVTGVSFRDKATDDDLAVVKDVDRLIRLELVNTKVTDAGLRHLVGSKTLRDLFFQQTPITDAGLEHLARLPQLEQVWVSSPGITDTGLVHLGNLTRLRDLSLGGCGINGAGLVHLKSLVNLRKLNLGATKVGDDGLAHLAGLTGLQTLDLMADPITDRGLEHLKGLVALEELNLWGAFDVTDSGLVWIEDMKRLRKLDLSGTLITDAGLVHLAGLTGLRELNLSVNKISDAALVHLRGLQQLRQLNLDRTSVSDEEIRALQTSVPKLTISHRKEAFLGPMPGREARALARWASAYLPEPAPSATTLDSPPVAAASEPESISAAAEVPARQEADGILVCSGRVREKGTRKPIDGAIVTVRRFVMHDTQTGGKRVLEETQHPTDAQGKYHFSVPPEQMADPQLAIVLHVEHLDYPPENDYHYGFAGIPRRVQLGDSPSFDVELTPGQPVTGLIETSVGAPAAGVLVHSISYYAPEAKPGYLVMTCVGDTRTDDQGRFRAVMVTPGNANLTFYPEHHAVAIHELKANTRGDLGRFVLQKGILLKGKVLDTDATPLAGVAVDVRGYLKKPAESALDIGLWSEASTTLARSAVTNADGEFTMAPLPVGYYRVLPVEHVLDPLKGETLRPLPAPFSAQYVTLKPGDAPPPFVVLRALPHVTIKAQMHDSDGKAARGPMISLSGNLEESEFWMARGWPDATGKVVIRAPAALESASLDLMNDPGDQEHIVRHRARKDAPLTHASSLPLGSLAHDVEELELVVSRAPTLVVKVTASDGGKPGGARVAARYRESADANTDDRGLEKGPRSDVRFTQQRDGRFRSYKLVPDESVTVEASANGYRPQSKTLKLAEGSLEELELVLDPM